MKKNNSTSYMTRALKSRDPRYARVLSKLGYDRKDLVAGGNLDKQIKNNKTKQSKLSVDTQIENFHQQRDNTVQQEADQAIPEGTVNEQLEHQQQQEELINLDLTGLRSKYKEVFDKQPYYGWDEDKLRQLIKEARE